MPSMATHVSRHRSVANNLEPMRDHSVLLTRAAVRLDRGGKYAETTHSSVSADFGTRCGSRLRSNGTRDPDSGPNAGAGATGAMARVETRGRQRVRPGQR